MSNSIVSLMGSMKNMSEVELRQVNSLVVAELRHRQAIKVATVKSALSVGDSVSFHSKYGQQTGIITRFKQKNIEVLVGHTRWTVSPTLLTKV